MSFLSKSVASSTLINIYLSFLKFSYWSCCTAFFHKNGMGVTNSLLHTVYVLRYCRSSFLIEASFRLCHYTIWATKLCHSIWAAKLCHSIWAAKLYLSIWAAKLCHSIWAAKLCHRVWVAKLCLPFGWQNCAIIIGRQNCVIIRALTINATD